MNDKYRNTEIGNVLTFELRVKSEELRVLKSDLKCNQFLTFEFWPLTYSLCLFTFLFTVRSGEVQGLKRVEFYARLRFAQLCDALCTPLKSFVTAV